MANDVSEKVDRILDAWQRGFVELQKKQELGDTVTDQDVKEVLATIGGDIRESGLNIRDVEANGYKVDEFLKITSRIPGYRDEIVPINPPVGDPVASDPVDVAQSGALDEVKINHDEFVLPKAKPASVAFGHVVQPLREETLVSLRHEDDNILTPEQEIDQKAYESARSLIEKLAPPESMTTGAPTTTTNEEIISQVMPDELSDKLFKKSSLARKNAPAANSPGADLTDFSQIPVKIIQPSVIRKDTRESLGPL